MRYFLFLLCFTTTLSIAQESHSSGKIDTSASANQPGRNKQNFLLTFNIGVGFPENQYGAPPANYSTLDPDAVYGCSQPGPRMDVTGIYLPTPNFGFAARFGIDIDNKAYQYLGGFYVSVKPVESDFNVYFLGLFGDITANVTTESRTLYASEQPGYGSGLCYYIGTGLSSKFNSFYFNFSVGYLGSDVAFSNGTITTYYITGPNTVSHAPMEMSLGILQVTLGASYKF